MNFYIQALDIHVSLVCTQINNHQYYSFSVLNLPLSHIKMTTINKFRENNFIVPDSVFDPYLVEFTWMMHL